MHPFVHPLRFALPFSGRRRRLRAGNAREISKRLMRSLWRGRANALAIAGLSCIFRNCTVNEKAEKPPPTRRFTRSPALSHARGPATSLERRSRYPHAIHLSYRLENRLERYVSPSLSRNQHAAGCSIWRCYLVHIRGNLWRCL